MRGLYSGYGWAGAFASLAMSRALWAYDPLFDLTPYGVGRYPGDRGTRGLPWFLAGSRKPLPEGQCSYRATGGKRSRRRNRAKR